MSAGKIGAFFHQYSQGIAAIGAGLLYLSKVYPQTWGIPKYMKFVQLHKDGWPVELDKDLKTLGEKVAEEMNLTTQSEANIRFFAVDGQDMMSKGSTLTKNGAIIGLPITFTYKSPTEINRQNITLNEKQIDWESTAGESLLASLILTDNAKRFAIARDITEANSLHVYSRALLLMMSFSFAYITGFVFSRMNNIHKRVKIPGRIFTYSVFAGLGSLLYVFSSEKYNWYHERKADRKAARLGLKYAEGGVEYYNRLLQRNIALRTLMGEEGGQKYTAYGNEVYTWRSPHIPLTARRDTVKVYLSEFSKSNDDREEV